ncbi:hypothetical protein K438DRAFT_1957747 [Mycena galopus ATCC 62051]|nr:hypothetical protein K438DRAFT_1957747 [Mycena galopus ATCC 62051]
MFSEETVAEIDRHHSRNEDSQDEAPEPHCEFDELDPEASHSELNEEDPEAIPSELEEENSDDPQTSDSSSSSEDSEASDPEPDKGPLTSEKYKTLRRIVQIAEKAIELVKIYPEDSNICALSTSDRPFTFSCDDFRLINLRLMLDSLF